MVSEGGTAHFCVSLNGNLKVTANVSIQTIDANATGMHTEKDIFSINCTLTIIIYTIIFSLLLHLNIQLMMTILD